MAYMRPPPRYLGGYGRPGPRPPLPGVAAGMPSRYLGGYGSPGGMSTVGGPGPMPPPARIGSDLYSVQSQPAPMPVSMPPPAAFGGGSDRPRPLPAPTLGGGGGATNRYLGGFGRGAMPGVAAGEPPTVIADPNVDPYGLPPLATMGFGSSGGMNAGGAQASVGISPRSPFAGGTGEVAGRVPTYGLRAPSEHGGGRPVGSPQVPNEMKGIYLGGYNKIPMVMDPRTGQRARGAADIAAAMGWQTWEQATAMKADFVRQLQEASAAGTLSREDQRILNNYLSGADPSTGGFEPITDYNAQGEYVGPFGPGAGYGPGGLDVGDQVSMYYTGSVAPRASFGMGDSPSNETLRADEDAYFAWLQQTQGYSPPRTPLTDEEWAEWCRQQGLPITPNPTGG